MGEEPSVAVTRERSGSGTFWSEDQLRSISRLIRDSVFLAGDGRSLNRARERVWIDKIS